jgi:hypothetical protein
MGLFFLPVPRCLQVIDNGRSTQDNFPPLFDNAVTVLMIIPVKKKTFIRGADRANYFSMNQKPSVGCERDRHLGLPMQIFITTRFPIHCPAH